MDSYVEYAVPDEGESLVLLSAVNDGQEQRVYVNISTVTEKEAAAFPENARFAWRIEGTDYGGHAAPHLPVNQSVSGTEQIRAAVLAHAYDRDTQTLTLQCLIDVQLLQKAAAELGTESVPFSVQMSVDGVSRTFGPVSLALTAEQRRCFDFGHALYHDGETGLEVAKAAFKKHVSQQNGKYSVRDSGFNDCSLFGLYWSSVGPDEEHNDLFEHVPPLE